MSSSLKIQLDPHVLMFAPNGEIDQFFQAQQHQQHQQANNNNPTGYFLPPDSVSTRGTPTTTPRTATTATADNSPRQSEGFETVSSIDEQQNFLREADQEFQMLLQSLAEGVAEIALWPEEVNQSKLLREANRANPNTKKPAALAQDPFSFISNNNNNINIARNLSGPPVSSSPSPSPSAFASAVVGGLDFDNLKLSFSQDLHTDMRLALQHHQHNSHHHNHHHSSRRINTTSPLSAYEAHSSPASPVSHILPPQQIHQQQQQVRPEWQKLCIQHSVCIHNIYGNCAYGTNCYYYHLESFHKPDLLFKTELCRYGVECANRPRCCFAHTKKERRTPEQNVREALAKIRLPIHPPHHHQHQQQQQQQQQQLQQLVGSGLGISNFVGLQSQLQQQQQPQQQNVFAAHGMLSHQFQQQQQGPSVVRQPIPIRTSQLHQSPFQQQQAQAPQQQAQQQPQLHMNSSSNMLFGDLSIFSAPQFQFPFQ